MDSLTHKAMQKSVEAEFVTEIFATAAAVSRGWVSLTQSGSVSVNSDCNADRTAKEEWLQTVKELVYLTYQRFTMMLGN